MFLKYLIENKIRRSGALKHATICLLVVIHRKPSIKYTIEYVHDMNIFLCILVQYKSYVFYSQNSETGIRLGFKSDWINSTKQCSPHYLFSYTGYKQLKRFVRGNFWLANIRRPIIRKVVGMTIYYYL